MSSGASLLGLWYPCYLVTSPPTPLVRRWGSLSSRSCPGVCSWLLPGGQGDALAAPQGDRAGKGTASTRPVLFSAGAGCSGATSAKDRVTPGQGASWRLAPRPCEACQNPAQTSRRSLDRDNSSGQARQQDTALAVTEAGRIPALLLRNSSGDLAGGSATPAARCDRGAKQQGGVLIPAPSPPALAVGLAVAQLLLKEV